MSDAKYTQIYWGLIAMVGGSALLSWLGHAGWAVAAIFALAAAKAFLVISYYMGLGEERVWVKWMLASAVLALAILFVGLIPDIVALAGRLGS
ncbi:MAG TPA: cytochrome C oxidase subunit IV family protein [bacterium]|nr:cytochrome C oxidase subunit IV family protein [bacterium]